MAISPVINAVSHMSWLPPQASPVRTGTGWTPPPAPVAPAAQTASSGAGDALVQGSRTAAEQAFLFGLKIAQSDSDRAAAARTFLAYTQGVPDATVRSDATLASLQSLAQSIVARTKNHHSFLA